MIYAPNLIGKSTYIKNHENGRIVELDSTSLEGFNLDKTLLEYLMKREKGFLIKLLKNLRSDRIYFITQIIFNYLKDILKEDFNNKINMIGITYTVTNRDMEFRKNLRKIRYEKAIDPYYSIYPFINREYDIYIKQNNSIKKNCQFIYQLPECDFISNHIPELFNLFKKSYPKFPFIDNETIIKPTKLYMIYAPDVIGKKTLEKKSSTFKKFNICDKTCLPINDTTKGLLIKKDKYFIKKILKVLNPSYIYFISKTMYTYINSLKYKQYINIIGITYTNTKKDAEFRENLRIMRGDQKKAKYVHRTLDDYKLISEYIKNSCQFTYQLPECDFIGNHIIDIYNILKLAYPEFPFTLDQFLIKN